MLDMRDSMLDMRYSMLDMRDSIRGYSGCSGYMRYSTVYSVNCKYFKVQIVLSAYV